MCKIFIFDILFCHSHIQDPLLCNIINLLLKNYYLKSINLIRFSITNDLKYTLFLFFNFNAL